MAYDFTRTSSQSLTTGSTPVTGNLMTLACWFNRKTTFDGVNSLFLVAVDATSGTNFNGILCGASANVLLCSSNVGAGPALAQTSTNFNLNEWNHACGVFTSSTSRTIYLNGAGSATNVETRNVSGQNNISIGARYGAGVLAAFADNLIAEVGIWNAALTADEIASLAKGMTCDKVRPQSLVFYAPLVRELQDVKGGLTITNNNTATVANHPRVYA
jgi:hypothetical protein